MPARRYMMLGLKAALPWLVFVAAEAAEFPPRLLPLDEVIMADPPAADGKTRFPERFNSAYGEADDFDWGHMNGYIRAPIEAVWAAVMDPYVIADRRVADSLSFEFDSAPEYDHSYMLQYHVDALMDVQWVEAWQFQIVKGSSEAPELVVNNSQKVSGSRFIKLVDASMMLEKVTDSVTRIEYMQHLEAVRTDTDTIEVYFEDLFASIVARVNDRPLPEY